MGPASNGSGRVDPNPYASGKEAKIMRWYTNLLWPAVAYRTILILLA